jgi:hypothetical protein
MAVLLSCGAAVRVACATGSAAPPIVPPGFGPNPPVVADQHLWRDLRIALPR